MNKKKTIAKARAIVENKPKMEAKIPQKLMLIADPSQLLYCYNKNGVLMIGDWEAGDGDKTVLLREKKDDPRSQFSMEYLSNSGITDRVDATMRHLKGVFKVENTVGGRSLQLVEKDVIVCEDEYHVGLRGEQVKDAFVINEDVYQWALVMNEERLSKGTTTTGLPVDQRIGIPTLLCTHLVFSMSSPAEGRSGTFDFLVDKGPGTLYRFLKKSDFLLSTYFKKVDEKKTAIELNKAGKRPKLSASSSKDFDIMGEHKYSHKEFSAFTYFNGKVETTIMMDIYVMKAEGQKDKRFGVMPEDFTVYTEEELLVPVFAGKRFVRFKKVTRTIKRAATDGASYMSAAFAERLGLDKIGSGFQFRAAMNAKGMMVIAPELDKMVDVDVLFFAGSIKGDISPYLEENRFHFSIMNLARKTKPELENVLKVSRQVLAAVGNEKMMASLLETNQTILEELYQFSEDRLKSFVGYQEVTGEEDDMDDDAGADMQNATVDIINTNLHLALQTAEMRKRLTSLLDATTRKIQSGAYLMVEEATIKHMMVDPYTIMRFLSEGKMSVVREDDGVLGIARKHAVVSAYFGESLVVEAKMAFLARFPFLHKMEGQLVNADGEDWFLDEDTKLYYEKAMAAGHFQGFVLYSLWDMVPEGQSGADYDGDTSLYITCEGVVSNVSETELFLDYSLILEEDGTGEGKLVPGCPFGDSAVHALSELISSTQLAFAAEHDIHMARKEDGLKGPYLVFPTELSDNEELLALVADAMAHLSMFGLSSNDIGRFTNIEASIGAMIDSLKINELEPMKESIMVMQAMLSLHDETISVEAVQNAIALVEEEIEYLEEEIAGYEILTLLLTVAIRWEIDKAKHGGAFREVFTFLALFEGVDGDEANRSLIKEQEEMFGISLERFMTGTKTR